MSERSILFPTFLQAQARTLRPCKESAKAIEHCFAPDRQTRDDNHKLQESSQLVFSLQSRSGPLDGNDVVFP